MGEKKQRKPFYKSWSFWAILIVVGIALGGKGEKDTIASSANARSDAVAQTAPAQPKDQQEFLQIVAAAQRQARGAENDMQRGGIKASRDQQICAAMKSRSVTGWIGTVKLVDANSDGKGVFTVEISDDVRIKTWNNAFSDMSDKTMFEPGSAMFNTASNLKKGQRVKVSGSFLKGTQGDCLKEASLSLSGKVQDPDFIFRFLSIEPM
ncbi:hypothetical protein [Achromobacter xylosoxidans]|uniref:hypothetical protein n=1 Tax=Alcaligenes xylosoxydans xylosoxydans TaxID=85698 RepID=UPI001EED46D8|nr:hypothetical protein [Achromobacter xylosoxidans]